MHYIPAKEIERIDDPMKHENKRLEDEVYLSMSQTNGHNRSPFYNVCTAPKNPNVYSNNTSNEVECTSFLIVIL